MRKIIRILVLLAIFGIPVLLGLKSEPLYHVDDG